MRKLYNYLALVLLASLSWACSDDKDYIESVGNDSSMPLIFVAPEANGTRGLGNPLHEGTAIKDFAVFICTETNNNNTVSRNVEAYRCITGITNPVTDLRFDMMIDDPGAAGKYNTEWVKDKTGANSIEGGERWGKNINKPKQGDYVVYAVANFSKYNNINNIISSANDGLTQTNPQNVLNTQLGNLINAQLTIGANNLANGNKMMLLSSRGSIELRIGSSEYPVALQRMFTRIKVTVRNETEKYPITVQNLQFTNLTRNNMPLFSFPLYTPGVGDLTPNISLDGGSTSSLALVPFKPVEIQPLDINDNVFDGYVFESSASGGIYRFIIKVEGVSETTEVGSGNYTTTYSVAEGSGEVAAGQYIVKSNNNGKVFYNDNSTIVLRDYPDLNNVFKTQGENEVKKYLWNITVKDKANNAFFFTSVSDGKIIERPTDGVKYSGTPVKLITKENENAVEIEGGDIYWYGNVGRDNDDTKAWYSYGKGSEYWRTKHAFHCIDADGRWTSDNPVFTQGITSVWYEERPDLANPAHNYFKFQPVTSQQTEIMNKVPTKVTKEGQFIFSKMVGNRSEIVKEIRRNEFYHIFINVRFNEKSKTFDFSVENWEDKNLGIQFN